ncbi:DMT family transporter [Weissella sp. MSCH1]|uniref:DMT family transporter n=1 Tax=Weissella sp. MSCH1 TaxID=3383343 RepID=UPI003896DCAD
MVLVFLGLSLFAGFMLANQNPINADMKKVVGSPFISAAISFLIGSIFLGGLSAVMSHRVFPSGDFISSNPAWIWLGGVLGAVYLTSNVLLFPRLGAIQTVILPILGQILMGTIIDTFGWFGTAQTPLTLMRVIGLIVLIAGVVVAVVLPNVLNKDVEAMDKAIQESETKPVLLGWQIWAIFTGTLSAMQQAINGHLGALLQAPAQGSFISFFVGFILITIVALVVDKRLPKVSELNQAKSWNWLGGILGGLFVFASVLSVPKIGAGLTITMGLIGQIVGSMLVQQFGWWRSAKASVNGIQILGVVVMAVGVVFIKFL